MWIAREMFTADEQKMTLRCAGERGLSMFTPLNEETKRWNELLTRRMYEQLLLAEFRELFHLAVRVCRNLASTFRTIIAERGHAVRVGVGPIPFATAARYG